MKKIFIYITLVVIVLVIGSSTYFYSNGSKLKEINPQYFKSSNSAYFKYQGKVWYSSFLFGGRGEPTVVEGADPGSFHSLTMATGQEYGADKAFAYCAGTKLEGSDGPSFNDNDPNYAFDKNQAYYPYCRIIDGADGSTFQVVLPGVYAKDKNKVYNYGQIITGVDGSTFQVLGDSYLGDKNYIYFASHYTDETKGEVYEVKKVEGADVTSFKVLKNGFAEDKNHMYFKGQITSVDYTSMRFFAETSYVADNNHVYYNGVVIAGADPKSFEIFNGYWSANGYYAKDSSHVYFNNNIIIGADTSTFVAHEFYSNDKHSVFYNGKKIEGSDGSSFQYDSSIAQGKDKNYTYAYGCVYKDNKQISCIK